MQPDAELTTLLGQRTPCFKAFGKGESGCTAYGAILDGERCFIKAATRGSLDARGLPAIDALRNALAFHTVVSHPSIPPLLNHVATSSGLALIYRWVDGEVLASPAWPDRRTNPASPYRRFLDLPLARKLAALDTLVDVHGTATARGYVAVDLYFGSMLYDFARHQLWLVDFDHYNHGPYLLDVDRQLGSRSLMAPEEFRRGARIDERTTVYTVGKIALAILAGERLDMAAWQGPTDLYPVVHKATQDEPDARFATYNAFAAAWRQARAEARSPSE